MRRGLWGGALTCVCLLGTGSPLPARPDPKPVVVRGLTHEWKGKDQYGPLPGVEVSVLRRGSVVKTTRSGPNGQWASEYKLEVSGGEPIQVLFYLSKDYVPEMQSLSARPGLTHHLSAALMTVKQYQDLQKAHPAMASLQEKLHCLSKIVPREHPAYKQIEEMLRKFQ